MEVADIPKTTETTSQDQTRKDGSRSSRFSQTRLNLELGNDYLIWSTSKGSTDGCHDGGIIVDSSLSEADGTREVIRRLCDHQGLNRCSVSLCLSIPEAMLRSFYVADVPRNELQQVVLWEAARVFPFEPDEELFAWRIINSVQWGGSKKYQIQAVALPPQRLRQLYEYLRSEHIIENVILTATAWETFLARSNRASQPRKNVTQQESCVAIVRLLGNRLTVFCLHNGNVEFTREAVIDSVNAGHTFEASLGKLGDDSLSTDRLHYQSLDINQLAATVVEEIDFYYGQFSQRSISQVHLAFPAEIENAAETALSDLLGAKVTPVLPREYCERKAYQPNYLFVPSRTRPDKTARRLSLVPAEIKQDRVERRRLRAAVGTAIFAVLVVMTAWWLQNQELSATRAYRDNLQQLTDAQLRSPAYQRLVELRSTGETWQIQWQQFRQSTDHYSELMKLLSNEVSSEAYITSMQILTSHPQGATKFVDASVNGFVSEYAKYPELVLVELIRDLQSSPKVRKVELRGHQVALSSKGRRLNFTLRLEML